MPKSDAISNLNCGIMQKMYQASVFSITSSLTKESRHCVRVTFELRPGGTGNVKYIKLLYVVDV